MGESRVGLQTNIATLVGHGTLRLQAGVGVAVEPTAAQMSDDAVVLATV